MKTPEQQFVEILLEWHEENARAFPWRQTRNPYKILIAELLLQRTRAEQVAPVYEEFIKRFPNGETVPDLETLSRLISKLGLTSRARRMLNILKRLKNMHHGVVPHEPHALDDLLGGAHNYTREAVLLYAFNTPLAPVDRIVARVLSRVFLGHDPDEDKPHTNRELIVLARRLLPENLAREYNFALLDFGALICASRPKHTICPLAEMCEMFKRIKSTSPTFSK